MTGPPRALLLDYAGVLTTSPAESFLAWERAHGFARGEVLGLVSHAYDDAEGGLVGRLERGEIDTGEFDAALARLLAQAGHPVPEGSLVTGLFSGMRPAGAMWSVAERARAAGVRTGLLSNSWGSGMYPHHRLAACFDVRVISGEVGLRKPDPAIFALALERLDVPAERCAFVDDLDRNVAAAERLGMAGVVHHDDASTVEQLERLLGLDLAAAPADDRPQVSGERPSRR